MQDIERFYSAGVEGHLQGFLFCGTLAGDSCLDDHESVHHGDYGHPIP
jgi:hypothetical protein